MNDEIWMQRALELARQGKLEIRQAGTFAPISFRRNPSADRS